MRQESKVKVYIKKTVVRPSLTYVNETKVETKYT
jgi:hypothetical protein